MKHKRKGKSLLSAWQWLLCGGVLMTSCQKPFDVNVKAEEPIKVDLSMDVHVYQHGGAAAPKAEVKKKADMVAAEYKVVMDRRRNRMSDIQTLKNDRIIGENHRGLLSLRISEGQNKLWPMDYVRKTVSDENLDRNFLIDYETDKRDNSRGDIEREQWTHQQRKSHPGEWIEVPVPGKSGQYLWVQKESPLKASE